MAESNAEEFSIDYPVGEQMLGRISNLFAANGNKKALEHLRWQYVANRGRGAYSAFAVSSSGEDAAVYSLFKVPAKMNGKDVLACQSLDTLTDKKYRGKGLFSLLAKDVNRRCDEDGIAFIYGFPNDKSGPGFFKHLQWRELGYPPFLIHVNNIGYLAKAAGAPMFRLPTVIPSVSVRTANFIRARIGGYHVREGTGFLSRNQYDDLWHSFSSDIQNTVLRDSDYLRWRYLDRPGADYQFVSIYSEDVLCAVVVFVLRQKHGGKIGYVMDVIYRPDQVRAGKLAVGKAIEALSAQKADVVLAWSSSASKTRKTYRSNWFFPLPRRMQPIKLFVGARIGPGADGGMEDEMFLSYADSDTV